MLDGAYVHIQLELLPIPPIKRLHLRQVCPVHLENDVSLVGDLVPIKLHEELIVLILVLLLQVILLILVIALIDIVINLFLISFNRPV